jgi:hypothetical protein
MTTYFGIWKLNTNIPLPQDPKAELQRKLAFQAMIKREMESGILREGYHFVESLLQATNTLY